MLLSLIAFHFFLLPLSALILYIHYISLYLQNLHQILFKLTAVSIIFYKNTFLSHQEPSDCEPNVLLHCNLPWAWPGKKDSEMMPGSPCDTNTVPLSPSLQSVISTLLLVSKLIALKRHLHIIILLLWYYQLLTLYHYIRTILLCYLTWSSISLWTEVEGPI